ncbi:type I secretion system permease/ATPase [uncultured Roseibium sp.]|uniref:type I secretion system permease/ATPase n=1 Tax=uncultured Roseibium sp. TaxID=1936171 RepID=UPI002628C6BD|nr:type I secretion system permease/ATPase [uncultured Roseibium sp.]
MSNGSENSVRAAIRECRSLFWTAFWFGLFINLMILAVPLFSLQVLDRVLSSGSFETLSMLLIAAGIALVFMGIMRGLRAMIFTHLSRWLDDRLSGDILEKTVRLSLQSSKFGSQPLRDLGTVRNFISSPHLTNLFDAPWSIIYFIAIYFIDIRLGLTVTVGAIALFLLAIIAERLPAGSLSAANDEQVKAMQSLDSILRNAEVVKAMGLLTHASGKWRNLNQNHLQHSFVASNIATVISQLTRVLRLSMQVIVVFFGAILAINNEISPGSIIAVAILTGRALSTFDAAAPMYKSLVGLRKALKRLLSLDEMTKSANQTIRMPEPKGRVSLEGVSFISSANERKILNTVDIDIQPGEAVGVIGPSGSGKTTMARLLVGVLTPTTGAVRLDGAVLDQWDPHQLGETIGYLPQDVELFEGTIAENIARLDPEADDLAVIEAARNAMVHETILSFPQGYHTQIGTNGSLLSAGQRQRVALARCFYGNPKLMVMDEPNSNLDGEGESSFVKAIDRAKDLGITSITIAHRQSVLQSVDRVLVLEGGEISLFGPTREVMEQLAENDDKVRMIHNLKMKA